MLFSGNSPFYSALIHVFQLLIVSIKTALPFSPIIIEKKGTAWLPFLFLSKTFFL